MEVFISRHNMARLKRHLDSPGLAPRDFSLFPTVKERLKNVEKIDEEDLFDRLKELFSGIFPKELDKVCGTWINRLITVSGGNGGCIS
jgi:predicted HAD superfamily phosphohydrolase